MTSHDWDDTIIDHDHFSSQSPLELVDLNNICKSNMRFSKMLDCIVCIFTIGLSVVSLRGKQCYEFA